MQWQRRIFHGTYRTHQTLGYTPNQLLCHLQTFPQWDQLKKDTWHLENLQPLTEKDNYYKNGRYDKKEFSKWLGNTK